MTKIDNPKWFLYCERLALELTRPENLKGKAKWSQSKSILEDIMTTLLRGKSLPVGHGHRKKLLDWVQPKWLANVEKAALTWEGEIFLTTKQLHDMRKRVKGMGIEPFWMKGQTTGSYVIDLELLRKQYGAAADDPTVTITKTFPELQLLTETQPLEANSDLVLLDPESPSNCEVTLQYVQSKSQVSPALTPSKICSPTR